MKTTWAKRQGEISQSIRRVFFFFLSPKLGLNSLCISVFVSVPLYLNLFLMSLCSSVPLYLDLFLMSFCSSFSLYPRLFLMSLCSSFFSLSSPIRRIIMSLHSSSLSQPIFLSFPPARRGRTGRGNPSRERGGFRAPPPLRPLERMSTPEVFVHSPRPMSAI